MAKAVRITSILMAALAVVLFTFPVVFGARSDEKKDDFFTSPSIIEKFKQANGVKSKDPKDQKSPLVVQAEAFALYLDPPPPPPPKTAVAPRTVAPASIRPTTPEVRPIGPVSVKFTVMATSYYASRPELSFALIDEPGKGYRWIKPSQKIGHLLIEQIKAGVVIAKDGDRTVEILAEIKPTKSLLKGAATEPLPGESGLESTLENLIKTENTITKAESPESGANGRITTVRANRRRESSTPVRAVDPQKEAEMNKLMEELKAIQNKEGGSADGASSAELMNKVISRLRGSSVDSEETKNLNRLGRELERSRNDPNSSTNGGGKLGSSSRRLPRPKK